MRYTVLFTLLITNIVSAAMQETPAHFIWNPYSPSSSMTAVSPPHRTLSPALPSPDSSPTADSLPASQIIRTLIEIEWLLRTNIIISEESQQSHLSRLLTHFEKLSTFKVSLVPESKDKMFIDLQKFLNRQYTQLGLAASKTLEQNIALQQQYHQLLIFFDAITKLTFFSTDQIEKLKCYHVSMLIGASNIAGIRKDNLAKKVYLEQALSIIQSIGKDVDNPYHTKKKFIVSSILNICRRKLETTNFYLQYDQNDQRQESPEKKKSLKN